MDHPTSIRPHHENLAELISDLGGLRYDVLADFLRGLAARLDADAAADEKRGRLQLAAKVRAGAERLAAAAVEMRKAWRLSAPHMLSADKGTPKL